MKHNSKNSRKRDFRFKNKYGIIKMVKKNASNPSIATNL